MIELTAIERTYGRQSGPVPAVKGVTLAIGAGEYCAVTGPSGSGKSTLLNLIGLLDRPTGGQYRLDGIEVQSLPLNAMARLRARRIGFVFQSFHLLSHMSALDNVSLGLRYVGGSLGDRRNAAAAMLARVGLSDRMDHRPSELSGGQQQRVAIARALVARPKLLLADEPTGNLDSSTTDEVLTLFDEVRATDPDLAIVMVTHDPSVARRCKRRIVMKDGRIVSDGSGSSGLAA